MRRRGARFVAVIVAGLLTAGMLAACGSRDSGGSGSDGGGDKSLTIPIAVGWDEDIAISYLWQHVLEENGYEVDLQELDVAPVFIGVAKGDFDMFFDVWLPVTHSDYWSKYKDKVEDIKVWYNGSATNEISVPEYMDVSSIPDLEKVGGDVDWTVTGIDPGAGLTRLSGKALETYGLKDAGYELKTSSTPAMLAALKKATEAKDPIVVTLWHPHWAYKAFPIKDLKDPEGAMGKGEEIHVIGREGLSEDHPDVYKALKSFEMDDTMLADLENTVLQEYEDDPEAGADAWAEKNKEYVDALMG